MGVRRDLGIPRHISAAVSDEENQDYAKALITAANADGKISDAERSWVIGYTSAAGNNAANLDVLRTYEGEADLEALFTNGVAAGRPAGVHR